jgi:predicted CXXCH cytochrome family protein
MPLTDYRIDYRFDGVEELMTVAGHMAQLRKSVCYQKRESLTCLTCHDPHAGDVPKNETAFYRQKCLGCHTVEACSLDQVQRLAKDPTDNCLICHMPRGATEFPHLAFTNHRILRNPVARPPGLAPGRALLPSDSSGQAPNLVPTDDNIQLSPLDRQRNLGLAYFEASGNPVYVRSGYAGAFHERALQLLEKVDAAGLADGETAGALANLYWEKDHALAAVYARQALQSSHLSAEARVSSLLKLAGMDMQDRQFEAAGRHLAEVVRLQRAAGDWYFLGLCYLQQNQPSQALPALQQSLSIRPDRSAVHARLAEAYRLLGDDQRATEHREKAYWLFKEHGD